MIIVSEKKIYASFFFNCIFPFLIDFFSFSLYLEFGVGRKKIN